ncbi:DUF916 and DUF3324 domain-containing protein [Lactiplantibacillus carotarum]|uniref:DUF916 and DUF3324 domain-containing protein n=1 Tax=Lactiplantibacillus carotarum TaxID=2993456 RepID=UPI00298EE104|nr:DUF916 and DUF3324 domain-containing protein [Lactiplantibacillus carotarum]
MKTGLQKWLAAVLVLLLGVTSSVPALAASGQNNDIGFSVAAHIPKNQINTKNSFFDLKMTKGQTETLATTIYNETNRDIRVQMAIHTAYTNSNGTIEYVKPAQTYDPSLAYRISDLTKIEGPTTVTVPANSSKVVSARVTMPNQRLNGELLGGWYFKRVDQPVTGTVSGTTNVQNQYSYVIGLRYASGQLPAPNLKLKNVQAGLYDYHRGIMVNLRNVAATMIPNVTTTTTITNANHRALFNNMVERHVQIAPNTSYQYPLLVGNSNLQAGRYHLHMVAKNAQHRWVFDRDFTITAAQARRYNHTAVDNRGLSFWQILALGALGMLLLVLLYVAIRALIRKRRHHAES